jgi:hypothetical protein
MWGFLDILGMARRAVIGGAMLLAASPLFAQAASQAVAQTAAQTAESIPEPSNIALFGLGMIGLILGRRGGRRKPRD